MVVDIGNRSVWLESIGIGHETTEITLGAKYFGEFDINLIIAPNVIEITSMFPQFTQLIADNWSVVAFQLAILLFFIVGLIFVRYFDKMDMKYWAFQPLINNNEGEECKYLVSIHYRQIQSTKFKTKNCPILLPTCKIRIKGDIQNTKWHPLLDISGRVNFNNNQYPANFLLTTFVPVGNFEQVEIAVESRPVFIAKIVIVDTEARNKYKMITDIDFFSFAYFLFCFKGVFSCSAKQCLLVKSFRQNWPVKVI